MPDYIQMTRLAVAIPLLTIAAACGGADNPSEANDPGAASNASAEAMPTGPFAQVEMQMHERMMAATGANASETWLRKMIEHHRGAVQMSQLLIDQGGDPQMVQMARQTAEKQQREIGELERLLASGISDNSGNANPFGGVEQQMHQAMMAATGANLSETWARKMIPHHQGAIDMSEVLIRQGGNQQVLAIARRTAEDQRREIAHLEALLRGESMPVSAPSAAANQPKEPTRSSSEPAARRVDVTPKAKAEPAQRPAQRSEASPPATPKQEPTPAPTSTCTPEHRAMGHC